MSAGWGQVSAQDGLDCRLAPLPKRQKWRLFLLRALSQKWLLLFLTEGYSIEKMAAIVGSPVTVTCSPVFFPSDFPNSASVFTSSRAPWMASGSARKNLHRGSHEFGVTNKAGEFCLSIC
jgi:hypothetical protein